MLVLHIRNPGRLAGTQSKEHRCVEHRIHHLRVRLNRYYIPGFPTLFAGCRLFHNHHPSLFETRQYHIRKPQSTGNVTEGTMPNPLTKPRDALGSQNPPAPNSTSSLPSFSFPAFTLSFDFYQLCVTIGEAVARIAMAFFALCSPWLAARQLYLLEMTVSAR